MSDEFSQGVASTDDGYNEQECADVTKEKVCGLLSYNPDTGLFTWKVHRGTATRGDVAGVRTKAQASRNSYATIMLYGKNYFAHRLAWLMCYGSFPLTDIDHINGDKADNRISNLRLATRTQNFFNRSEGKNNTSGHKGVWLDKRYGKFQAYANSNHKRTSLGMYKTFDEAVLAYREYAKKEHGEFVRLKGASL